MNDAKPDVASLPTSKAEQEVRARLAAVGDRIRIGSDIHLAEMLLMDIRDLRAALAKPASGDGPKYSWGADGTVLADFTADPGYWTTPEQPGSAVQAAPAGVDCLELLPWSDFWQRQGRPDVSHNFAAFELAEAWATACISAATPPPAPATDQLKCPECGAPGLMIACIACSAHNYPPAPAAEQGDDSAMEGWRAAVDAAQELYAKSPTHRHAHLSARVLRWIKSYRPTVANQPEARGVEGMALVPVELANQLQPGYWREVYIGWRHMRVELTLQYDTWERLMKLLAAAPAAPGVRVDEVRRARAIIDHVIHGEAGYQLSDAHDLLTDVIGKSGAGVGVDGEWLADVRRCLEDVSTEMRSRGRGDERFQRLIQRMPAALAPDGGEGE